jgi:hypothetical protein
MKTKLSNRALAKGTHGSDVMGRHCGRGNAFRGAFVFAERGCNMEIINIPKDLDLFGDREYTPKQMELIRNFWLFIHRKEKSKHAETIQKLLALAANE